MLGYKGLNDELELAVHVASAESRAESLSDADASERIRHCAHDLGRQADKARIDVGCAHLGVAVACLWRAGQENAAIYMQGQMAEPVGVTLRMLRERFKDFREAMDRTVVMPEPGLGANNQFTILKGTHEPTILAFSRLEA